jgi:Uma2 family endonuclease
MSTAPVQTRYTPDDLLALENGNCFELIDGQLVEKNMGAEAGVIAANVIFLPRLFVRDHGGGVVSTQDAGYQIFPHAPDRVRKPDTSFIRHGRLPGNRVPRGNVSVAPDLVVEVVSPNDLAEEVNTRVVDYLLAGVRLIWVIYPATRFVQVFRPGGVVAYRTAADELGGEDVLPGFACRVEELFAGLSDPGEPAL